MGRTMGEFGSRTRFPGSDRAGAGHCCERAGIRKRLREPCHPWIRLPEAKEGQARQVASYVVRHPYADRRRAHQVQTAGEDPADQDPSDAPVAIGIRMDQLELGVRDRGLGDRIDVRAVHVSDQIVEQRRDQIWGRDDQGGVQWTGPPDPALQIASRADQVSRQTTCPSHQAAVPTVQRLDRERTFACLAE